MQFYKYLYVSPLISHPGRIKQRLRLDGKVSVYVITLTDESLSVPRNHVVFSDFLGEEDQNDPDAEKEMGGLWSLQFFHSAFLRQRVIRKHCPMVIGLAPTRWDAITLVQRIVEDSVRATGEVDILGYLSMQDSRICPPKRQGEFS